MTEADEPAPFDVGHRAEPHHGYIAVHELHTQAAAVDEVQRRARRRPLTTAGLKRVEPERSQKTSEHGRRLVANAGKHERRGRADVRSAGDVPQARGKLRRVCVEIVLAGGAFEGVGPEERRVVRCALPTRRR